MGCDVCSEYCVLRGIRSPSDLHGVVAWAKAGLDVGTLCERHSHVAAYQYNTPFLELAKGGPWDDGLAYRFACTACGQEFELGAETYHGRGGSWSKLEDAAGYGLPPVYFVSGGPKGVTVFVFAVLVLLASLAYFVSSHA